MSSAIKCLVIGRPRVGLAEWAHVQGEDATIGFSELWNFFPALASLELIKTPLFANDFDALELIDLVAEHGYRGTIRVVSPGLPNRVAVLRELRAHAMRKGIKVELVDEV